MENIKNENVKVDDYVDKKMQAVFSKWLAEYLCVNGHFHDLRVITKNEKPGYDKKLVFLFFNSPELQDSIKKYTAMRKSEK